jgi:hypothetical protein
LIYSGETTLVWGTALMLDLLEPELFRDMVQVTQRQGSSAWGQGSRETKEDFLNGVSKK